MKYNNLDFAEMVCAIYLKKTPNILHSYCLPQEIYFICEYYNYIVCYTNYEGIGIHNNGMASNFLVY